MFTQPRLPPKERCLNRILEFINQRNEYQSIEEINRLYMGLSFDEREYISHQVENDKEKAKKSLEVYTPIPPLLAFVLVMGGLGKYFLGDNGYLTGAICACVCCAPACCCSTCDKCCRADQKMRMYQQILEALEHIDYHYPVKRPYSHGGPAPYLA